MSPHLNRSWRWGTMRLMWTNPFLRNPRVLARLPRIVRLYIFHCLIGFLLSAVFTGLILWLDVAGIGHLVTHVAGGYLAALVFFVLNGIVFAGVQTGIVIMSMDYDDTPKPPRGHAQAVRPPLAVRINLGRGL